MTNLFLTDDSLKGFIEATKLPAEDKEFLFSKVPEMDKEERTKLFHALKEVYFIDKEEEKTIENLKRYQRK